MDPTINIYVDPKAAVQMGCRHGWHEIAIPAQCGEKLREAIANAIDTSEGTYREAPPGGFPLPPGAIGRWTAPAGCGKNQWIAFTGFTTQRDEWPAMARAASYGETFYAIETPTWEGIAAAWDRACATARQLKLAAELKKRKIDALTHDIQQTEERLKNLNKLLADLRSGS